MHFSSFYFLSLALLSQVQTITAAPFDLSDVLSELERDVEDTVGNIEQAIRSITTGSSGSPPPGPPGPGGKTSYCQNGPTSRRCWGNGYSVDTNSYTDWPNTGVTRDFYFDVVNQTLSPDGFARQTLSFNGQIPGPPIVADWGDIINVHINNKLDHNGTAIHFHGMRQLKTNEMDGVPGVTQCPIAPGQSQTYTFQATEYGTSWYHSHDTLQYSDGLAGPILINGPASADYDIDMGVLMLTDWSHDTAFQEWWEGGRTRGAPTVPTANALINGTNTFTPCIGSVLPNCVGSGQRWSGTLEPGKKHLFRIVNSGTNGFIRFSVDNHNLTVIANDFVPINPWNTSSIVLAIGQRYDIIVQANQAPGNYWLRSTFQQTCIANGAPDGSLGILTYDGVPKATPNTTTPVVTDSCDDPPVASLVPRVQIPVTDKNISGNLGLSYNATPIFSGGYFRWYINGSDMVTNWSAPSIAYLAAGNNDFGKNNSHLNTVQIPETSGWSVWIIQDHTNTAVHPLHIHGHDFWVMAQLPGQYAPGDEAKWNLQSPPRRDTAGLPKGGYLALAVQVDNPGAWLFHCHVPTHVASGLSVQFLERNSEVKQNLKNPGQIADTCSTWNSYTGSPADIYPQDDSGL